MLIGLCLGNLIDLDHIYSRIIKQIGWKESAIKLYGKKAIFGFYPLHNYKVMIILSILSILILLLSFIGFPIILFWVLIGAISNQVLDIIAKYSGFML